MDLYLSSFEFGDAVDKLQQMARGRRLGFVPNALDSLAPAARSQSNMQRLQEVRSLDLNVTPFDLKKYFGRKKELEAALADLDGLWVRGGNAFVLRKAMYLSGLDTYLAHGTSKDFLYAGYSAGICVLGPSLHALRVVDDPSEIPYVDDKVVWNGLDILNYLILPHFESNHPESARISKAVELCLEEGIKFRTLRDGDVIVLEDYLPFDSV